MISAAYRYVLYLIDQFEIPKTFLIANLDTFMQYKSRTKEVRVYIIRLECLLFIRSFTYRIEHLIFSFCISMCVCVFVSKGKENDKEKLHLN